jgi:hypothetical protein
MGTQNSIDPADEWDLDLEEELIDLQLDLATPLDELLRMYHGESTLDDGVEEDEEPVGYDMITNKSQYSVIHDLFEKRKLYFFLSI